MERRYRPGERVRKTGIYRVEHDSHRLMHEATLVQGNLFPRCKRCDNAVRFSLVRWVENSYLPPFRSTELLEEFGEPYAGSQRRSVKRSI
jgi:hypothetical protein